MAIYRAAVLKHHDNLHKIVTDMKANPGIDSSAELIRNLKETGAKCGNCTHCNKRKFSLWCKLKKKYLLSRNTICERHVQS